jgi:RNA polymerase sigma factor (sigma-70 family)
LPLSTIPKNVLESLADVIDQAPLPDELLANAETQMLIRECLSELNTRYRQALVRKYVDGWKVAAIAADFNVSEKAAESLLSRAREAFKSIVLAKLTSRHLRSVEILE